MTALRDVVPDPDLIGCYQNGLHGRGPAEANAKFLAGSGRTVFGRQTAEADVHLDSGVISV